MLFKANPKLAPPPNRVRHQRTRAWRPGYDVTAFFGRSGLYDSMREGDDGMVPMARPAQGDHTTGLAAVGAILARCDWRKKPARAKWSKPRCMGRRVDSGIGLCGYRGRSYARGKRRRDQLLTITGNRFPCGDGNWVVFNMLPDAAYWSRLCKAIGLDNIIEDERFIDSGLLQEHGRADWYF